MSTAEMSYLTDAVLDEVSGGEPNLGGYTYCPGQGLYVGGCPTEPTLGDVINAFTSAFHKAAGR
jgi:hypothetical protein